VAGFFFMQITRVNAGLLAEHILNPARHTVTVFLLVLLRLPLLALLRLRRGLLLQHLLLLNLLLLLAQRLGNAR